MGCPPLDFPDATPAAFVPLSTLSLPRPGSAPSRKPRPGSFLAPSFPFFYFFPFFIFFFRNSIGVPSKKFGPRRTKGVLIDLMHGITRKSKSYIKRNSHPASRKRTTQIEARALFLFLFYSFLLEFQSSSN